MAPGPQSLLTPSQHEIHETAERVVSILTSLGLSCCLIGSAASIVWGATRTPNDIDVVVMSSTYSEETIKRFIAVSDSTFYLVASTNPRNTYKILWHRYPSPSRAGLAIKVDILVPPTLNIPFLSSNIIITRDRIPVMPLLAQLLLKLQGWDDHKMARQAYKRDKQYTDAEDVKQLLNIAVMQGINIHAETWLSRTFKQAGKRRIRLFVQEYPETRDAWNQIGSDTIVRRSAWARGPRASLLT